MNEQTKFAFECARDTVSQFLTLATGIVALTITFSKDFVSEVPYEIKIYALWSWGFMLCSVFFGLWSLMALTGTLANSDQEISQTSIRSKNITRPAPLQIILFFIGLIFVVIFGIKAV